MKGFRWRIVLSCLWLMAAGMVSPVWAGIEDALVPPSDNAKPATDEGEAKLRASLEQQIADSRKEEARLHAVTVTLQKTIGDAPVTTDLLRKNISVVSQILGRGRVDKMSLEQLNQQLSLLESQQRAIDMSLSDIYEKIATQQNLPTSARLQIADLQTSIAEADQRIESLKNASDKLDIIKRHAAEAERDMLLSARKYQELQLEGYQKILELLTANRDLLTAQLGAMQDVYDGARQRFDSLSKDEAARKQAAFSEIEQSLKGMPSPVIEAAVTNRRYNDEILMLEDGLRQTSHWNKQINDVTEELRQRYQIAQQQLDIGGYNQFYMEHVRYVTRDVRPLLNQFGDEESLRAALVEARGKQFSYDDQLRELHNYSDRQRKISQVLEKIPSEQKSDIAISAEIQRIYSQREQLLGKLSQVNGNYVVAVTNYELARKQLEAEEQKFNTMLNRKLVWLHSSPPLSWDVFLKTPKGAYRFFRESEWSEIPATLNEYRLMHPAQTAFYLLPLALLIYARPRLLARLDGMSDVIGRVGRDRFRYTVEAAFVSLLVALPMPLLLWMIGIVLLAQGQYQSFAYTLGEPVVRLGQIAMLLSVLQVITRENGLGSLHFRWPARVISLLRRHAPLFAVQIPVYMLGMLIVNNAGEHKSVFMFGRVLLLASNLMLAWNFWHLLRPGKGLVADEDYSFFDPGWRQRFLWTPLVVGVPLVCAGLLAWGYDFSVVSIARLFYITLFAGFGIFLAHQILTRWFAVQERLIALDRARARRAASQAAKAKDELDATGDVPLEVDAIDEINLETISERNRGLLKILASVAMIYTFWHLWIDLAPALDILDKYVLWTVTDVGDHGEAQEIPITLWRVLCSLSVLVVMVIAGRNLPGLVEVVLLQRFKMDKSIRFAITTVATYCIYAVGLMVGSQLLGIAWQKIGWLVAALGVGLGFGLQEIFANFISGIIILIERPIRIGDLVSIGGQSGTVTQIRIRATTLTDSDRRELIIPNKAIVTTQLSNWSLSDNVSRLVFPIGVELGADPERVVDTLLVIAHAHPAVMKQPSPGAYFMGFGDIGEMKFELRVFVSDFSRRVATAHDINVAIEREFRQRGFVISKSLRD